MSSVLRNVVIHPPTPPRSTEGMFQTVSRTDGKTGNLRQDVPQKPKISPPKKCPLCGNSVVETHNLFSFSNGLYKCRICHSQINQTGEIVVNGVF